jgi:xanthine dehydrogenase large subunit
MNFDAVGHVRGESIYLDDIPELAGTLHGAVFASPMAHGVLRRLDLEVARRAPGVVAVLTAADIPGENQIGGIVPDETLLAESEVQYVGEPIAVVFAASEAAARAAVGLIVADIDPRPAILDPREAARQGKLIVPPRSFRIGDVESAWSQCAHVFTGRAETGGQEHLYIEAQGAYAVPVEAGGLRVHSSTQGPTAVQRTTARVLGIPMHQIEVDVTRLGGGFGGKEDQATPWAVLAALGAWTLRRPCKIVLHRQDDMRMTGKRHPYSSDFKIGLAADLRILAYDVTFYQDAGAAADLSPAVLERTLFHHTNAYFIPHARATAYSCRTNVVPHTAFRGFGGPQGMFVIEAAIAHAAESLGIEAAAIQERNLLRDGDKFPYGQVATRCHARRTWEDCATRYDLAGLRDDIARFNAAHATTKKGLALMPICFGISFTKTFMNQASALVHVYQDGSVGVSTAAVEMGQGVNAKLAQVAAQGLGVPVERVRIESTNTTRVANTSPSAASASADLNGKAVERACEALRARLRVHAATQTSTQFDWNELVRSAFLHRVPLTAQAHYATPEIHFDWSVEKGHPFAYHAYGTAAIVARVDVVRGTYVIESCLVSHDFGRSLNPIVDRGQAEGGIVQGIGWMTMEELLFDGEGRLRTGALSTYKVPDIYAAPERLEVHFLDVEGEPHAILGSKAVGEPPLLYGIGAYFAVRRAVRAANPAAGLAFSAPITPEKTLLALYRPHPTPHLDGAATS